MSTVADDVTAMTGSSTRRVGPAVLAAVMLALIMGGVWWWFFALKEDQAYRVLFSAGTADAGSVNTGAEGVAPGRRLSTGDDGFITVRLSDGTVVKLMPNTTLDIEDARGNAAGNDFATRLRLLSGEIESSIERGDGVRRDLSVFSNSIAIGVRGTVFTVQQDGDEARLMVTRGKVEAAANQGGAAPVAAGEGTVARSGGALGEVSTLPQPPVALSAPAASESGIALAWDAATSASEYLVEFAEDDAFNRLIARHRVDWSRGTVAPLARDGRYFWRVASIDGRGLRGRYSAPSVLEHDFHIERSRAALRRLDTDAALSSLTRSLKGLDPEIDALRERGRAALAAGDLDGARSTLETVLQLRPEDPVARNALARTEFMGLDYSGAEAHYRKAIDSGDAQQADTARAGLALIRVRQGRFQEGLDGALEVLGREPRHLQGLNVAAMASVGLGNRAAAAQFVRRALEVAPQDPTAASLALSLEEAPALPGRGS